MNRRALASHPARRTCVANTRARWATLATLAALGASSAACHKVEISARCVVRTAGSYCTFQNTGHQLGQACFKISVRPRDGVEPHVATRACSGPLHPGEETAAQPISFGDREPFDRCSVDPITGQPADCVTVVASERLDPL